VKTRTSTGLLPAVPATLPEHTTGCLIQFARMLLTQWPLDTTAAPEAPPLSLRSELTQCTDQLKLSADLVGSVTTSRNVFGGRTWLKGVLSAEAGNALWRAISLP